MTSIDSESPGQSVRVRPVEIAGRMPPSPTEWPENAGCGQRVVEGIGMRVAPARSAAVAEVGAGLG